MDTVTRRKFLAVSGVAGAGVLLAGGTTIGLADLLAHRDPGRPPAKTLVLITLYGGNDALNMVVPYADPAYRQARSDLAYEEKDVHVLGDGLALNPSMSGLAGLWKDKRLAVVRGVGYPKPDHSHFRSMDIWQSGSPDHPADTGWLGRWLDATGHDPLKAVSLGATLPPLLAGAKGAGSALPNGRLGVSATLSRHVSALARGQQGEPPMQAAVATSDAGLLTLQHRLGPAVDGTSTAHVPSASPDPSDQEEKSKGASAGGQSQLAEQLSVVARCIVAGVPTQVYAVSLGGFDTHADEKGTQSRLLGELDTAIAGFLKTMGSHPAGRDVVVATYSEFGRRVKANASQGTDHGTSGVMFVAGQPVRGGFYGDQPSLTSLDDGDLKVTTDFRAVYGELLTRVLQTDPHKVLSTVPAALGFL